MPEECFPRGLQRAGGRVRAALWESSLARGRASPPASVREYGVGRHYSTRTEGPKKLFVWSGRKKPVQPRVSVPDRWAPQAQVSVDRLFLLHFEMPGWRPVA